MLGDIGKLRGKYSIILYKWLTMNYNQYKKYKNDNFKKLYISIEELRQITDTENEYERLFDFEKRIIKESLDDINSNTHYDVSYEKIKKGRKVEGLTFKIKQKYHAYDDYIESKDKAYEKRQDNTDEMESKNADIYIQVIQDYYIRSLISAN